MQFDFVVGLLVGLGFIALVLGCVVRLELLFGLYYRGLASWVVCCGFGFASGQQLCLRFTCLICVLEYCWCNFGVCGCG